MKTANWIIQLILLLASLFSLTALAVNQDALFWLMLMAIPVGFFQMLGSILFLFKYPNNRQIKIHTFIAAFVLLIFSTSGYSYDLFGKNEAWAFMIATSTGLAIYYWILSFSVLSPFIKDKTIND